MLLALGRSVHRWRFPVLGAWLLLTLVGAALGGQVFDRLTSTDGLRPDAESQRAERRVDQLLPQGPVVIAIVGDRDPYDPELVTSVTAISTELRGLPGVVEVDDLYSSPGGRIGADNRSTLVQVELAGDLPEAERERVEDRVVAALRRIDAPRVLVGGEKLAERAFADQAIRDAAVGESIALAILLIALTVLLGGVLAGAIPLLAALCAVSLTLLGLLGLSGLTEVGEFTVNVVTLLGIGLTVDYALLILVRFREERAADPAAEPGELLGRTVAAAGRAVLVAGLAVAAAMAGLAVFAEPLLATMALGGLLIAVLAGVAGLTLVPALIAVTHRRIPAAPRRWTPTVVRRWNYARRGDPGVATPGGGMLATLTGYAQRRPGPVAFWVCTGLILLAGPFLAGANLANSDARALPASMEARQAYDVLLRDFEAGRPEPVVVVVEADPATAEVRDLMNQLMALPQVVQMQPRPDVPGAAMIIDLTPAGETGGPESRALVDAVRALDNPAELLVGGAAAEIVDHRSSVLDRLPLALLVLLLTTGILLFALTGSVLIPVKALLLNAMTVLATLGVLVVVFQWGVGAGLLGVESWGAIDLTTPVLLFVFVFALTMDYEVFLLARIRQEWERGSAGGAIGSGAAASDRAVQAGITRTGPVVTAAAVCMTIVFLGFLLGELTAVKEIGFGMVVAVILDVTVVRGLLLPAVMSLLGEWNWWAPAPLRRLHDRFCRVSAPSRVGTATEACPASGPVRTLPAHESGSRRRSGSGRLQ